MNLEQILSGYYTKAITQKVVEEMIAKPEGITELMLLFQGKNQHISNYSGWIISYLGEKKPELLHKYLSIIIQKLENDDNNSAMIRNVFRTLQFVDIPEKHEGYVLTKGFEFLNNNNSPIAVKVFAMTVVFNLSVKYPEIQKELKLSLENQLEHASAGFKSRATKILKKLTK